MGLPAPVAQEDYSAEQQHAEQDESQTGGKSEEPEDQGTTLLKENETQEVQPPPLEPLRGSQQDIVLQFRRESLSENMAQSQQASQPADVPQSRRGSQQVDMSQSRRGSQQVDMSQSRRASQVDMKQEFEQGSQQPVDDKYPYGTAENQIQRESESKGTLQSSSSFVEGEDEALQTYSIISLEDGIWLNRKTGKLLMSHSQQTSLTAFSPAGRAAPEDHKETSEEGPRPPKSDLENREGSSHRGSCPAQSEGSYQSLVQAWGEEREKVIGSPLSQATLESIESTLAYADEDIQTTYNAISVTDGSWVNIKTGKVLVSRSLQTEESSFQKLEDNVQVFRYSSDISEPDLNAVPEADRVASSIESISGSGGAYALFIP
uniref:Uncharacterized protein n=1 Tax=Sphaerodactylus townsendi TaxID=933632 RepID=A0ACB8G6S9_9SAUR